MKTYGDDVAIVYRHRALPFHKHARTAAIAMQAAAEQGKAWEMHDKLFENLKQINPDNIPTWAGEIGLDMTRFNAAMKNPAIAKQVDDDAKVAEDVQASGTPTFFINGRRLVGAKPFDDFKRVIDEELKKAEALLAKGTPIAQVYDQLAKNQKAN